MESKKSKKEIALLPVYFKKVGLVTIILTLVPAILIKSMNVQLGQTQKDLFRIITFNGFILGLLFIAWSKDKIEDEMTLHIRLKGMAFTFAWTILYYILTPFFQLLFDNAITDVTGQQVVMTMLFVYLIMYYLQKWGR